MLQIQIQQQTLRHPPKISYSNRDSFLFFFFLGGGLFVCLHIAQKKAPKYNGIITFQQSWYNKREKREKERKKKDNKEREREKKKIYVFWIWNVDFSYYRLFSSGNVCRNTFYYLRYVRGFFFYSFCSVCYVRVYRIDWRYSMANIPVNISMRLN